MTILVELDAAEGLVGDMLHRHGLLEGGKKAAKSYLDRVNDVPHLNITAAIAVGEQRGMDRRPVHAVDVVAGGFKGGEGLIRLQNERPRGDIRKGARA